VHPAGVAATEYLRTDGRNGTMRYLLFICSDEVPTEEKAAVVPRELPAWVEEVDARGVRVEGHRLRPATEATTVRVRDGEVLISDGPFAETKELVGGFDIIECADLDEAIAPRC
jgi:hypothetical protein